MPFGLLPLLLLSFGPLRPLPRTDHSFVVVAQKVGQRENCLSLIPDAIREGAEYVEFDLRETRDKRIVALRDLTINRTTTAVGRIDDYDFAELSFFKLRDSSSNETIPELDSLIRAAKGKVNLLLMIRSASVSKILRQVEKYRIANSLVIGVSTAEDLAAVRSLSPEIPIAFSYSGNGSIEAIWNRTPFEVLLANGNPVSATDLAAVKSMGVAVWGTAQESESAPDLSALEKMGYSGMRTSTPKLMTMMRRKQKGLN